MTGILRCFVNVPRYARVTKPNLCTRITTYDIQGRQITNIPNQYQWLNSKVQQRYRQMDNMSDNDQLIYNIETQLPRILFMVPKHMLVWGTLLHLTIIVKAIISNPVNFLLPYSIPGTILNIFTYKHTISLYLYVALSLLLTMMMHRLPVRIYYDSTTKMYTAVFYHGLMGNREYINFPYNELRTVMKLTTGTHILHTLRNRYILLIQEAFASPELYFGMVDKE